VSDDGEIYAPVLLAVHNDTVIDGQMQFVERSYLLPTEALAKVFELVDQYEVGSAHLVTVGPPHD